MDPVQPTTEPVNEPGTPDPAAPLVSDYSWQASEYIYHEKPAAWYLGFWVLVTALCGALGLFGQWLSVALILIMAMAVLVYTRKHPRTLNYHLDERGITIESKTTSYHDFKSYSIMQDMAWHAIDLEPSKRFVPRLTLICENDDVDTIESILSQHLPRADREQDWIEKASRYLRF